MGGATGLSEKGEPISRDSIIPKKKDPDTESLRDKARTFSDWQRKEVINMSVLLSMCTSIKTVEFLVTAPYT